MFYVTRVEFTRPGSSCRHKFILRRTTDQWKKSLTPEHRPCAVVRSEIRFRAGVPIALVGCMRKVARGTLTLALLLTGVHSAHASTIQMGEISITTTLVD